MIGTNPFVDYRSQFKTKYFPLNIKKKTDVIVRAMKWTTMSMVLCIVLMHSSDVSGQVEINDFEINHIEYQQKYRQAIIDGDKKRQAELLEIIVKDYNAQSKWDSVYRYNNLIAEVQLELGNKERYLNAYMVNISINEILENSNSNHKEKIEEIAKYMDDLDLSNFRRGEIAVMVGKYIFYNVDRDSAIVVMDKAIAFAEMPEVDKAYALGMRTQKAAFLNGMNRNEEAINELIYVANNENFTFEPALKRWYVLDQLGELFLDIEDYRKAEEYFTKAIRLAEENNYVSSEADSKLIFGGAKIKEGKVDEGQLMINQSLEVFRSKNKYRNIVSVFTTLGESYLKKNNLNKVKSSIDSAEIYLDYVQESSIATNRTAIMINLNLLKAEYYLRSEKYEMIEPLLLEFFDDKVEKDYPSFTLRSNYLYYEMNKAKGNTSASLDYYERYIAQRDALADKNNSVRVQLIESQFNRQEQDKQIAVLDAVTEEQQKSLSTRNTALVIGGFMLAFLAGLLIGLYRLFKKNKEYQSKLEVQNMTIQNALAENKILIKEIHHRVKNNLQVISSLLSLQERKVTDENTKEALKSSKTRVETMSILHQSLYQGDEVRGIGVKKYFTDLISNLIDTYTVNDNIQTRIDIDELRIDVDSMIPIGLVANELICNALKHGLGDRENGYIAVSLKEVDDKVILSVADSGAKLSQNALKVREGSLGVKLINAFTNRLDGKLEVQTGSETKISLLIDKENINFIDE